MKPRELLAWGLLVVSLACTGVMLRDHYSWRALAVEWRDLAGECIGVLDRAVHGARGPSRRDL